MTLPHWTPEAIRDLADCVAAAVFSDMEAKMNTGTEECAPVMPLLEGQRPYVMAAIVTASARVLQASGLDTDTTTVVACGECQTPLAERQFIVWTIGGKSVPLCVECSKQRGRE